MMQSMLANKLCQQHKSKITYMCFNQMCESNRLVCQSCLNDEIHFKHLNDIKEYQKLEEILDKERSECKNQILKLKKMENEVLNLFQTIKKGINDNYNQPIERINKMTNDQFNQYLSTILQSNIQIEAIIQQMETYHQDYTNKLNRQMREFQLDSLTYLEIVKDDSQKVKQLFQQGYSLYWDKQDYMGAIFIFDQALAYNPNHLNSLFCKATSLSYLGKYIESIQWYDKSLSIDPQHISSIDGKGHALRSIGKFQESIEWFDKSLAIDPKHANQLYGKGDALQMLGRYKESIVFQDQALIIHPKFVDSLYSKGEALRKLQQVAQAQVYFDQVLAINQNHFQSLGSKGACLNQMGKYQEAYDVLGKAIQVNPKDQFSLKQIKICREKLQK